MNPYQDELEYHKNTLEEIFTIEKFPAILTLLNSLLPHEYLKLGKDEYTTVTNLAKYEGSTDLIKKIRDYINDKN